MSAQNLGESRTPGYTVVDTLPDGSTISWTGGEPTWQANGRFFCWGPRIEKVCTTKTGARFAAWRRTRKDR